jgi:membrane protein implicated in regulation of membrane protease activity
MDELEADHSSLTLRNKKTELERGMVISGQIALNRPSTKAYTLIELLAFMLIVGIAAVVYGEVRTKYGLWPAVGATALWILASALLIVLFLVWTARRDTQRLTDLRNKYRDVYRVKAMPTDPKSIVKAEGAEIQIGDYGWEACPNQRDNLIHLQGLTEDWHVVWHAGFRPDQIERVGQKPQSQYDYWVPYWAKLPAPPPCPLPVKERNSPTLGLPHHSGRYFELYPSRPTHCLNKKNA